MNNSRTHHFRELWRNFKHSCFPSNSVNQKIIYLRVLVIIALLITGIAIYFFWDADNHKTFTSSIEPIGASSITPPSSIESKNGNHEVSSDYNAKVAAFLTKKPTREEQSRIEAALSPLGQMLREREIQRSKVLKITEHPETSFIILEILPPTNDEIQMVTEELSKALSSLAKGTKIYNLAREQGTQSIQDYTAFPKPFKFIEVVNFKTEENKPPRLGEIFVDKAEYAQPNANGSLTINWGRDKYRADDNYGEGGRWANKRYGHLSELWLSK